MKSNRKLIALTMVILITLTSFAGCKQKEDEAAVSEPQTTIVETADTPDTADIAETKDTPDTLVNDSDDEDDEEVKTQPLIMAVKSSSSTSNKDTSGKSTSSKNTSSAVPSKASLKTPASKATSTTQPTTITTINNGNAGSVNNQNTVTSLPDPEPVESTPQQTQPVVSYYEPEPAPQPEPEPEPEPTPEPEPEPPAVDSPYARPFDVETIRNDMIAYGQERGLVLDESLNIDNAGWSSPDNTRWWTDENDVYYGTKYQACLAEIDSLLTMIENDGVLPSDVRFNVQIVEIDEYPGEYRIYVPYG